MAPEGAKEKKTSAKGPVLADKPYSSGYDPPQPPAQQQVAVSLSRGQLVSHSSAN